MNLTIRRVCIGIVTLNAVAALCLVVSWMFYSEQQEAVTAAQKSRYESYLLADELRQSSDDLTRLARTYVVTGDPAYEAQYLDVVAIRGGEKPRPVQYSRIYWDFVAAGQSTPRPADKAISLLDLMREAGFTQQELAKLDDAKNKSDGLILLSCGVNANVLRFLMPLTAPDTIIEEGFDILEKTIGQVLEASAKAA